MWIHRRKIKRNSEILQLDKLEQMMTLMNEGFWNRWETCLIPFSIYLIWALIGYLKKYQNCMPESININKINGNRNRKNIYMCPQKIRFPMKREGDWKVEGNKRRGSVFNPCLLLLNFENRQAFPNYIFYISVFYVRFYYDTQRKPQTDNKKKIGNLWKRTRKNHVFEENLSNTPLEFDQRKLKQPWKWRKIDNRSLQGQEHSES